jgi:putative transposase
MTKRSPFRYFKTSP